MHKYFDWKAIKLNFTLGLTDANYLNKLSPYILDTV